MNLGVITQLMAYGTSEGVRKEWDERGRGKNESIVLLHPNKANPKDLEDLKHVEYLGKTKTVGIPDPADAAEDLLNWIGKAGAPDNTFVVHDKNGDVLGALLYGHTTRGNLEVIALATHPDVIKGIKKVHGVGTSLMVQAAKEAAKEKVGVELVALPGAESFYGKLGMKIDTKTDHYMWTKEEAKSFAQHAA